MLGSGVSSSGAIPRIGVSRGRTFRNGLAGTVRFYIHIRQCNTTLVGLERR